MFKKLLLVLLFCVLSRVAQADTVLSGFQTSCIKQLGVYRISFNDYSIYHKYETNITNAKIKQMRQQNIYLKFLPQFSNYKCQLENQEIEMIFESGKDIDVPGFVTLKINGKTYIDNLITYDKNTQKKIDFINISRYDYGGIITIVFLDTSLDQPGMPARDFYIGAQLKYIKFYYLDKEFTPITNESLWQDNSIDTYINCQTLNCPKNKEKQ